MRGQRRVWGGGVAEGSGEVAGEPKKGGGGNRGRGALLHI